MIEDGNKSTAAKLAVCKTNKILADNKKLPNYIFQLNWKSFLFFDPDWVYDKKFINVVRSLLQSENGLFACIKNLEISFESENSESKFFVFDSDISETEYIKFINKTEPKPGWQYSMCDIVCTSDVGSWCIYGDRAIEIAILALETPVNKFKVEEAIGILGALPIEMAIKEPPSYGLSFKGLRPDWRNELLNNYANKIKTV